MLVQEFRGRKFHGAERIWCCAVLHWLLVLVWALVLDFYRVLETTGMLDFIPFVEVDHFSWAEGGGIFDEQNCASLI